MPYDDHTSAVLLRQRMRVFLEGERVGLEIASFGCKMDYETALKLSQWLRVMAKRAKRLAGDQSRHWSAIAFMDDVENS